VISPNDQILKRLKGLLVKRPGLTLGLWGEAGIGKSHTAQNLLQEIPCKNLSQHSTTSLSNLARALPKPKKLPVWAERILEKLERDEVLSSEQTTSAFGAVLFEIAPFILHLEDVHEASLERLEWIQALARVITRLKGVALIVTSRTEPPEPFETIRLEKLEFEAVRSLLENEARALLPLEAIEWIHAKAAGNPLFTLEFFRFLARLGFVWNDGRQWRWRKPEHEVMPVTVEAIIEHELALAEHSSELEQTLNVLTLLPLDASSELIASLSDLTVDAVQLAAARLEQMGILSAGRFSHPLYREINKRRISVERRRQFARRFLNSLEHDPELAIQYLNDAALSAEQTLGWYQRASQAAQAANRDIDAARLVAHSVEFATGDQQSTYALRAAQLLLESDQNEAFRMAQIAFEAPQTRLEAGRILTELLSKQGRKNEAFKIMESLTEDMLTDQDKLFWSVQIYNYSRDYQEILNLWQQHQELSENTEMALCIAMAIAEISQPTDLEDFLTKLSKNPNLDKHQKARLLNLRGISWLNQGQYEQAIRTYAELIQVQEAANNRMGLASALYNRSIALRALSRYDAVLQDLETVRQICLESGNLVRWAHVNVVLATNLRELARFEEAQALLLESSAFFAPLELIDFGVECEAELCVLYLESETPHGHVLALKYAQSALRAARQIGIQRSLIHTLWVSSRAAAENGLTEQALKLAEEMLGLAQATGNQGWISDANGALGTALLRLNRFDAAMSYLQEAKRTAIKAGSLLGEKRIDLELARINHDLAEAKKQLDWLEANGFSRVAHDARRYFPELLSSQLSTQTPTMPHLELLGTFQITFENTAQTVRGRKRQELLVLLLEARIAGKSEISRLELLDALYPDDDEDRAVSSLKELIRGTRANLGAEVIQTTQNGYALGQVTTDVEAFFKTGDSSLWRGGYLQNLEFTSSETMRESLELALQTCTEKLLETNPKEAARVSRFLLEMNLYDLGHLRLCIQALKASDNYKTLGRVYTDARERLAEVGESLPERWQDFLEILKPA
jgi:tetratricopeptide (TPR) repeat protein